MVRPAQTALLTPSSDPASPSERFRCFALLATTGLCLLLMLWAASNADGLSPFGFTLRGHQADYYNLLVDGLIEGRLSMKVSPGASGQLPYLMDASLYQGEYYMYFGIVPVLLTLLPYSWLTGHDLSLNVPTFLYVAGGFLFTLRLYVLARRRYFPRVRTATETCAIVLLAFGGCTPILVFDSSFYELALAGNYLCLSAALLSLYQSIHEENLAGRWLTFASLALGLAVGCRPTSLLVLPVLLVPLLRHGCAHRWREHPGRLLRLAGATIIPAGIVGLALMAYNYSRFDDPFEFGFKYQVNALIDSGLPFAKAAFIPWNLDWYYFTPPVFSPHFPYVLPINASVRPEAYYGYEMLHGQWLVLPLAGLCAAGMLELKFRGITLPTGLKTVCLSALVAFGAVFAALLTFGFRANRYVADFQPSLIVVLALTGGFVAAPGQSANFWFNRLFRPSFGFLALALAVFNYLVGIQWMNHLENTRPAAYRPLAYYGNYPSYWLHRLGLVDYGPARLHLIFPTQAKSREEVLLATGTSGYTDTLFAIRHQDGTMQIASQHSGSASIFSEPVPFQPGTEHVLTVDIGSLYPPRIHPYYRHWTEEEVDRVKHTRRVLLDGVEILHLVQPSYDASPWSFWIGRNPVDHFAPFSGQIMETARLASLPARPPAQAETFGIWSIEVVLPTDVRNVGLPVLSSGLAGRGNLLLLKILSETEFCFGFDQWGAGITHSPVLSFDAATPHRIDVLAGPQLAVQNLPSSWQLSPSDLRPISGELQVWFDGQLAWRTPIKANQSSFKSVGIGTNHQGFSTASPLFSGSCLLQPLTDADRLQLIRRALESARTGSP